VQQVQQRICWMVHSLPGTTPWFSQHLKRVCRGQGAERQLEEDEAVRTRNLSQEAVAPLYRDGLRTAAALGEQNRRALAAGDR
jgi:hypothetical protein